MRKLLALVLTLSTVTACIAHPSPGKHEAGAAGSSVVASEPDPIDDGLVVEAGPQEWSIDSEVAAMTKGIMNLIVARHEAVQGMEPEVQHAARLTVTAVLCSMARLFLQDISPSDLQLVVKLSNHIVEQFQIASKSTHI